MVSVLIPSIPERAQMLHEAQLSVESQTLGSVIELLIDVDEEHCGCAKTANRLASRATQEWMFILADDDLMLPGCLATHLAASVEADIVYAPPLVWGTDASPYQQGFPCIPSASLIRTSLWRQLGGYNESLAREEDRDFYIRAQQAGARVVRVSDQPTWVYRIHAGSKSMSRWTPEQLAARPYA